MRRRSLRWKSRIAVAVSLAVVGVLATQQSSMAAISNGHQVGGAIEAEWNRIGPNNVGWAVTDELNAANYGKFQVFERPAPLMGNSIYWHQNTGARQVGGLIRDKWRDYGWETGSFRYPTTSETPTPQRPGAFNHFEGGSIYWSPNAGTHQIWGMVRDQWAGAGWENSPYGFPKSDEYVNQQYADGYRQDFENGSIQVVDMKVPAYGYVDPTVVARNGDEQAGEATDPSATATPSDAPESTTPNPTETEVPEAPESLEAETSVRPTPPASIMPTTPGVDPPASEGGVIAPRTWPFGDFCVLGTYGGPGGACRFGDGVSMKDATCMATLVMSVATNVLPVAKLLKIRGYIKAVGGAREAFERWNGQKSVALRAAEWARGGQIGVDLSKEFLGLTAIVAACQ